MSFGWAVFHEEKTDLLYRLATYVYLLYYVREALTRGVHVFRCGVVPFCSLMLQEISKNGKAAFLQENS